MAASYVLTTPTEMYVPVGYRLVVATPQKKHHALHATVTLLTGGLWLPVWIAATRR